jgi:hypothetical protein
MGRGEVGGRVAVGRASVGVRKGASDQGRLAEVVGAAARVASRGRLIRFWGTRGVSWGWPLGGMGPLNFAPVTGLAPIPWPPDVT